MELSTSAMITEMIKDGIFTEYVSQQLQEKVNPPDVQLMIDTLMELNELELAHRLQAMFDSTKKTQ